MPVSVKIRLLDTPTDTVEFARRMEKAGACALTVHVRYVGAQNALVSLVSMSFGGTR